MKIWSSRLAATVWAVVSVLGISLGAAAAQTGPNADPLTVVSKKVLSLEGAHRVLAAAVAEALAGEVRTGAIAIVDRGGNLIVLERLDGTFAAASRVATGKARTAALFEKPTRVFEKTVNEGRTTMVALEDFTPLQGGVPIVVDGEIVGAIGVSGSASAQRDDDIAIAGAAALSALTAGTAR